MQDRTITLPPNDDRTVHAERRPVVVISGSRTNDDPSWPVVLVAPLSSSTTHRTAFCVKVAVGEGGATKKTWVRVPAVQPLLKTDLEDYSGTLPPARLEEIQARLLQYMGVIDQ